MDNVGRRLFARDFSTKVRHSASLPSTFEGEVPARPHHSSRSCAELSQRFDLFIGGQWDELHQEAMRDAIPSRSHPVGAPTPEKKARMACQKVRIGEVSRARQCLTGASVAPGTDDTFRELQDRRPQVQRRELPREVLEFVPERLVDLDRKTFFDSLRSAPWGSSAGVVARMSI